MKGDYLCCRAFAVAVPASSRPDELRASSGLVPAAAGSLRGSGSLIPEAAWNLQALGHGMGARQAHSARWQLPLSLPSCSMCCACVHDCPELPGICRRLATGQAGSLRHVAALTQLTMLQHRLCEQCVKLQALLHGC